MKTMRDWCQDCGFPLDEAHHPDCKKLAAEAQESPAVRGPTLEQLEALFGRKLTELTPAEAAERWKRERMTETDRAAERIATVLKDVEIAAQRIATALEQLEGMTPDPLGRIAAALEAISRSADRIAEEVEFTNSPVTLVEIERSAKGSAYAAWATKMLFASGAETVTLTRAEYEHMIEVAHGVGESEERVRRRDAIKERAIAKGGHCSGEDCLRRGYECTCPCEGCYLSRTTAASAVREEVK